MSWLDGLTAGLIVLVVGLFIAWIMERQRAKWAEWERDDALFATRALVAERDAARQELRDARVAFARNMTKARERRQVGDVLKPEQAPYDVAEDGL